MMNEAYWIPETALIWRACYLQTEIRRGITIDKLHTIHTGERNVCNHKKYKIKIY